MKKNKYIRFFIITFLVISTGCFFVVNSFYGKIYKPNCIRNSYLYIPTGSDYDDVIRIINEGEYLKNNKSFAWLAKRKNYVNKVHSGRYRLDSAMTNNDLINRLRSGYQAPVRVVFHSVRTKADLAGKIAKQIEADSLLLIQKFTNDSLVKHYGFSQETFSCIFLPKEL